MRLLALCLIGAASAVPLVPQYERKSLKELRQALECETYVSIAGADKEGGDPTLDSWCASNCAAGNCNEGLCMCEGGNPAGDQEDAGPTFQEQLEARTDLEVDHTKVDQKGEQGLPFKHAIIGYWGAGPYTPFEGEEGPTIADALKQGYNVICVSFGDQVHLRLLESPHKPDPSLPTRAWKLCPLTRTLTATSLRSTGPSRSTPTCARPTGTTAHSRRTRTRTLARQARPTSPQRLAWTSTRGATSSRLVALPGQGRTCLKPQAQRSGRRLRTPL